MIRTEDNPDRHITGYLESLKLDNNSNRCFRRPTSYDVTSPSISWFFTMTHEQWIIPVTILTHSKNSFDCKIVTIAHFCVCLSVTTFKLRFQRNSQPKIFHYSTHSQNKFNKNASKSAQSVFILDGWKSKEFMPVSLSRLPYYLTIYNESCLRFYSSEFQ